MIKGPLKTGFSFGLVSGLITTLGLMVGLHSGTHSKLVVIGGVLTIAIADSFSDALGIHISEEAENVHSPKEIWAATIATFLTKFVFALTFVVPILLLELSLAIVVSIVWGLAMLGLFSFSMAQEQKTNPWRVVAEHLFIAVVVVAITHCIGKLIAAFFC